MIPVITQKILHGLTYTAAGGAVVGAFAGDELLTWSAVTMAISSAILTAGVAGYHKLREAARQESIADRAADLEAIRAMARIQIELEARIVQIEKTAGELVKTLATRKTEFTAMFDEIQVNVATMHADLERRQCKFPSPDGTPRCVDEDRPEHRGVT